MKEKAIIYVFVGDGLGVPGLAHEITQAQADADGVGELLTQCISLGVYVEKTVGKTVKEK
ncbi:MAG: hypothetical protein CVU44_11335 [Chloroflexi bacterium HGW-Chloroflexi-6]|nr:MAG: hypothetical protein CVU44_11335 [Chloroflexi bacterium HGW-Chloroflexi-6]